MKGQRVFSILVSTMVFFCTQESIKAFPYKLAITQANHHSETWAVAHHVYFLYESLDQIPEWEPYLLVHNWSGGPTLEAFGKSYRTVNLHNLSDFTLGIASAYHFTFPPHMKSIAHIQGSEYFNMVDQIRMNQTHTFGVSHGYDAMWILPHHAWQGPFLAERNQISETYTCPYVWSPHILEHRGTHTYQKNTSGKIGIYETNVGVYKMSFIPLLIVNKLSREEKNLVKWWEVKGLAPISTGQFTDFLISLKDAIRRPFNISKFKASIPKGLEENTIGTILTHQFKVGINNLYLEALHMNMPLVHNSPFFKDCGYYYEGFNVTDGANALKNATEHHDSRLESYAGRSRACVSKYMPSNAQNVMQFRKLLQKWIPPVTTKKFLVGITAHDIESRTFAIVHHTLFMYDTIAHTKRWKPVLLYPSTDKTTEISAWGKKYSAVPHYTCVNVYIVSSYSQREWYAKKCPEAFIIYFAQGIKYVHAILDFMDNVTNTAWTQTPNMIWTTPQFDWQGDFLKHAMGAQDTRSAPYVWEPDVIEGRQRGVRYQNGTNKRIGVYETNRGIYKMSLLPMLIVEHLHKEFPIEYADARGLQHLYSSSFEKHILSHFKAPWSAKVNTVQIPKHWAEQRIGIIVSHSVRCGLNYMWLEAIHVGIAIVHNSEHLPKGCGYYYPGENVTAGAEALRRAIETHNDIEAERQRNICLPPFSTSNPDNIAWYERLLDEGLH